MHAYGSLPPGADSAAIWTSRDHVVPGGWFGGQIERKDRPCRAAVHRGGRRDGGGQRRTERDALLRSSHHPSGLGLLLSAAWRRPFPAASAAAPLGPVVASAENAARHHRRRRDGTVIYCRATPMERVTVATIRCETVDRAGLGARKRCVSRRKI